MSRNAATTNAILWAAAIISAALLGASTFFTIIVLPLLATLSLELTNPRARKCRKTPV